jgi:hypothetical protein
MHHGSWIGPTASRPPSARELATAVAEQATLRKPVLATGQVRSIRSWVASSTVGAVKIHGLSVRWQDAEPFLMSRRHS